MPAATRPPRQPAPTPTVPTRTGPTRATRLVRLVLENFRSYHAAELHPAASLTIVTGPNGAGKTNLLEGVYTAIAGRSQRASADHELVRHGAAFARVRLELADADADATRLELVLPGLEAPPELRKRLTVNGVARRPSSVFGVARAVLFRPEEMLLLVGPPSERRRLLDGLLAQRDRRVAHDLAELARVLAQRNALLRAIRSEEASPEELGFWDVELAQVGARVMAARLALVAELRARIGPLHDAVAPEPERGTALGLAYVDSLKEAWPGRRREPVPPVEELVEAFRLRLLDVRQREVWHGVSLIGPQRDDLRVALAGRDVGEHASRGQQRTIILALKLAETDLLGQDGGPQPLVLLDDVFSELDPERTERLLALLLQRGQVLVTTADLGSLPAAQRHRVPIWHVDDGRLAAPRVA